MDKRDTCLPLLWLGIAGLLLSLLFGIYLGSSSASKIEGRITRDIDSALSTNGYSDWAKADVDGQKVRLTGQAPSARLKDAAINAVMTASGAGGVFRGGVTKVIDKMEIAPLVSPYVWSATRKGGIVTLSGHAPDRESLKAIVSTASEKFDFFCLMAFHFSFLFFLLADAD